MALGSIIFPVSEDGGFASYCRVNGTLRGRCSDADGQVECQGQVCVGHLVGDDDVNGIGGGMEKDSNGQGQVVEAPGRYQKTNMHQRTGFYPVLDLDQDQMDCNMYLPPSRQYHMSQYHPEFGHQGRPRRCFSFQRHTTLPTIAEGPSEPYPSCPFCKAGQTTAISLVNHLIHDDCPNAPRDEAILDRALHKYDPDGSITRRVDELVDFFTASTIIDDEVETNATVNVGTDAALGQNRCPNCHTCFRKLEEWHSHMQSGRSQEWSHQYPNDQNGCRSDTMERMVHDLPYPYTPTNDEGSTGQEMLYTVEREGTASVGSTLGDRSRQYAGRRRPGHMRNRSVVIQPSDCQPTDRTSHSQADVRGLHGEPYFVDIERAHP